MKTQQLQKKYFNQDALVGGFLLFFTLLTVATTAIIAWILFSKSYEFFAHNVSLKDFFSGTEWNPLIEPRQFGIWPLLAGTLQVVAVSGCISVPIGLGCAIYLSEYASKWTRSWAKPLLEILAGIPSVVFGYFAVAVLTPFLQQWIPSLDFFNGLSAGIVVGIMIIPTICSLCEESLRAVPKELRFASFALGITKEKTIFDIVIPAAFSGIVGAFLLGFSRAFGETMAVTLAAGSTPNFTLDPMVSIQTLTSFIVQVSLGDTPEGTPEYLSMYAVALMLFAVTMFMNIIGRKIIKRVKIHYD